MTAFLLPALGENVAAGVVARILVRVGETLAKDQGVVELETDKATVEVPSTVAGVVRSIAIKPGDRVQAGALVLEVDGDAGVAVTAPAAPAVPAARSHAAPTAVAPLPEPVADVPSPPTGLSACAGERPDRAGLATGAPSGSGDWC